MPQEATVAQQETKLERAAEAMERRLGPTLDKGAEFYDRFAGPIREQAKLLASAVPVVGAIISALDDTLGTRAAIIREDRVHALLRMTVEFAKAIDESKLDRAFLGSLEWSALLEGGMLKAMRAWQEEKVRIFAQFLANAMMIGPAPGYRERLLKVVDSLTLGHVIVLRTLVRWTATPKPFDMIYPRTEHLAEHPRLAESFPGMGVNEILGYIADLRSRGLALEGTNMGTRDAIDATGGTVRFPWVLATPQGFEVIAFISGPASDANPSDTP